MSLLSETQLICKQYNILPSRSRGQNFLINEDVYQKIIKTASLTKNDTVLEVGPGLGFLTSRICQSSGQVIAVELDKKIFDYLSLTKKVKKIDNLKLINKNILDINIENLQGLQGDGRIMPVADTPPFNYKIVANLPYNITSIFLKKFLSTNKRLTEMVLMLQKEVAQRIAPARRGQMSLLAVSVQFYANAEIVDYVDKKNFWPEPKVDSAIIKLKIKNEKLKINEKYFFQIVKIGFSARRKKLVNNLANGLHKKPAEILPLLQKLSFDDNTRAQELGVRDWLVLAQSLKHCH